MARRIVWTVESRWWLREIYDYLSEKAGRETAFKVVRGILDRTRILVDFPELGHRYEPARDRNVRTLLYGKYRILYLFEEDDSIHILGVFHGALDLERHLKLP